MKKPNKPLRPLIWAAMKLSAGKYRKKYGLTIDKSALSGVKPPYIVLFNHVGDSDHNVVGSVLYPVLANYMVSRWVQHSFPTGPLSALAGAIHKDRFVPDVEAVLAAKEVLIKRKGVLAVAPAASYSIDGSPNYFDFGMAKLAKLFKVPVYAVVTEGLYTFRNRFMDGEPNECRLTATAKKVFDGPELRDMDIADIYKTMYDAIAFDDFEYQKRVHAKITSHEGGLAYGMEYVAYRCPVCGGEAVMASAGDRLYCESCGYALHVNDEYMFEAEDADAPYFESLREYNKWQLRLLDAETDDDDFSIACPCTLARYTEGRRYGFSDYGRGVLTLDRSGFTYDGTDKGEHIVKRYPLENTPYCGNDARKYLSFDTHDEVFRYRLDDMRYLTKYLQALVLLRMKLFPRFEGDHEWHMERMAGM